MSVLIEAITLVVPKIVLDISFPGGADAYCHRLLELERPPRFICNADPALINASFHEPRHIAPATALLHEHSIVGVDDGKFVEYALVDQRFGPTMPCEWLEWRTHKDGFTYAWRVGETAGDMAAPADWTAQQSKSVIRSDIREEPGRMMKLAQEGGVEIWLDLATGQIMEGLAQREVTAAKSPGGETVSANPGFLLERVRSSLAEWGLRTVTETPTSILYRVSQASGVCDVLVMTDDDAQLVGCYTVLPVRVPAERRSAVAEALVRANWNLRIGNFDLDFTDGEIRFRSAVDVEGGDLAATMVHNLVGSSLHTVERFQQALMRVAFGDVDPAMAILEVGIESSGEEEPDDEGLMD